MLVIAMAMTVLFALKSEILSQKDITRIHTNTGKKVTKKSNSSDTSEHSQLLREANKCQRSRANVATALNGMPRSHNNCLVLF